MPKAESNPKSIQVVQSRRQLGQIMRSCRRHPDQTVGLVPTMGALHAGHLSLVEASTNQCDVTIVTIFVNPAQFGPNEDLSRYPQRFQEDLAALSEYPVEIVFAPTQKEMYPPDFSTYVDPPQVAQALEGRFRPNHFQGVATIVLKLFHLIPADISFFGQKDYQQSLVIRHMIRDLDLPMRVVVCPTVRDGDGLAMSSRNSYLSPDERKQALALSQSLKWAAQHAADGERRSAVLMSGMRHLFEEYGVTEIDYIALVDPDTLQEVDRVQGTTLAAVAAHIGETRLIDNCFIEP